jgi:excinuclease UvrABC nuclease subunit
MNIEIEDLLKSSHKLEGNCSGIYFLFHGNELVYIGRGWNCLLRVAEHTRKETDKLFTSWNYLPVESEAEYKALERDLIRKFSPIHNKTYKKE